MPCTGGGATTKINASWIAERRLNNSPVIAPADWCGSLARSSNGESTAKMAPALGASVNVAPEKPTTFTALETPGTFSAISTARRLTSSVRASEAPGGSCTTMIR